MASGKKKALTYVSRQHDLSNWFWDFTNYLEATPKRDSASLPESFATGYMKVFEIADGLTCRIVDYKLNTDFFYEGSASPEFHLIIYFYNYLNCHSLTYEINDQKVVESRDSDYSSVLMTNSFTHQRFNVSKGTSVKGITIEIKKSWLRHRINPRSELDLKILRSKDVFQTMIKPSYRSIMAEILRPNLRTFIPELYLSSRVLRLLEFFFNDILKNGLEGNVLPVSTRDVKSLFQVEQYLLQHYREPFPTVKRLSKMAMMSGTKLKQIFKNAFGISLFAYFQQNRMYRARELLQSGLYTVTEVGEILGYQNMSNFSTAFKKEFGVLPKTV